MFYDQAGVYPFTFNVFSVSLAWPLSFAIGGVARVVVGVSSSVAPGC
jgi:hypothetical protein